MSKKQSEKTKRITKNNLKNWSKNAIVFLLKYVIIGFLVTVGVTFFFHKLATEQLNTLTEKSTEEIVEALFPNDFSLMIDGKNYSPGKTCKIKSKTKEIEPYFAVENNSKYPAKDTTIIIYLEKNTIKEGMQALDECFRANGVTKFLEVQPTTYFEGKGFVISSPIYHAKGRYVHSLKFQMIKNKTIIVVEINRQHKFYLVYNISKDGEKEIPKTLDSPIRPENNTTKQMEAPR